MDQLRRAVLTTVLLVWSSSLSPTCFCLSASSTGRPIPTSSTDAQILTSITNPRIEDTEVVANPLSPARARWTDYLVPRTVQIRHQTGKVLLWQKYHALGYRRQLKQQQPAHITGNNESTQLSHSAATLWRQYDSFSPQQQQQFQQKVAVETRASQPLCPDRHLHVVYCDAHILCVNKPSGVLSVPGPRRNPSLATLVYDLIRPGKNNGYDLNDDPSLLDHMDQVVAHRLDMDTSGIMVFALSQQALSRLHDDFRLRRLRKQYQALLVGHLPVAESDIQVPLERDPLHPPFMRIAQPRHPVNANNSYHENPTTTLPPSFQKKLDQAAKPSWTDVTVLAREYFETSDGKLLPVTRVQLVPHTGRTHQLRAHCSAIGYPIVGDVIYGIYGEGEAGGISGIVDQRELHHDVYQYWRQKQQSGVDVPRLCLHAQQLCLNHPITGAPMVLQADPPF